MIDTIGKITKVPIREVWKDEAKDFTPWLFNNLDILADELGCGNLTPIEREKKVGTFSADISAEDESGQGVVIENQLERTDHDHLGKILTYVSNLDAKKAIWISDNPKEEHVTAVEWLNKNVSDAHFYLVKIEIYKIGESKPAPRFTVITGPNATIDLVRGEKNRDTERHKQNHKFWTQLLEKSNKKTIRFKNISPRKDAWVSAGAGKRGLGFVYTVGKEAVGAELYIDWGKDSAQKNKQIFDALDLRKSEIEKSFGEKLDWERLDDGRASRIRKRIKTDQFTNEKEWPELQDMMVDAMTSLEQAFKEHIAKLKF